ncbi:MAG: nuclear transport factor 2 family protein [Prevotellaceae bacterium]|nr:nuclear transport factor 2 family protein [Candidatus Colivivens equi]
MKKVIFCFALIIIAITNAIADVKVTISDGLDNPALVSKMEKKMSDILTEVNRAQASGKNLDFKTLKLSTSVQKSMSMLWENSPFECTDEEIVESCIETNTGYQIRNIPLLMKPRADRAFNESEYQEAVISFDRTGEIESFYLSISMNLYMNVVRANKELTDLRRRQLILDYVEQFRTSYNTKDINFLEQVFSDDALIITGKVVKSKKSDGAFAPAEKITYKKYNKQEYITHLKASFAAKSWIKVTFDEIEVMRHPVNVNFYGVTLHQGYSSSNYHDDGYLFLLWDFTDESHPQIHVRTWQPDKIGGKQLPKDEIFSLSDFDI